jgi:hypothetical protein
MGAVNFIEARNFLMKVRKLSLQKVRWNKFPWIDPPNKNLFGWVQ